MKKSENLQNYIEKLDEIIQSALDETKKKELSVIELELIRTNVKVRCTEEFSKANKILSLTAKSKILDIGDEAGKKMEIWAKTEWDTKNLSKAREQFNKAREQIAILDAKKIQDQKLVSKQLDDDKSHLEKITDVKLKSILSILDKKIEIKSSSWQESIQKSNQTDQSKFF